MRYNMTLYVKVEQNCGPSKFALAGYRTRVWRLVYKIAKNVASNPKCQLFFLTANFDGPQFGSPLRYKNL